MASLFSEILSSQTFALKMVDHYEELAPRLGSESKQKAASAFRQRLSVEARRGGVLVVSFRLEGSPRGLISTGEDQQTAQLAADIVNTMLDELQDYCRDASYQAAVEQRDYIGERLGKTETKFEQALEQLATFQQTTGIMEPNLQLQAVYRALGDLEAALGRTRAKAQAARQATEAAGETDQRAPMVGAQTGVIGDIKRSLVNLNMQLARAQHGERMTDAHPEVRRLKAQIEEAQQNLASELDLEHEALAVQQLVIEAEVAGLERERDRQKVRLEKFPVGSVDYARLKADLAVQRQTRELQYREWELAAIREKASYRPFQILDPAVAPLRKSGPSTMLNALAAAFLVGLATLIGGARRERPSAPAAASREK